jgi:hypothetical protein
LYILLGTVLLAVEIDEGPVPTSLMAIRAGDPIIDAVALRLKSATADRLREYLRADDGAAASGAAVRVPVVAH